MHSSLSFVIPVKPRKHTKNLTKCMGLLLSTVEKAASNKDSKIYIISSELLNVPLPDNAVNVVVTGGKEIPYGDRDKEYKIYLGSLLWLTEAPTSHLMLLDADDLVSSRITDYINGNTAFEAGYQKVFDRYFPSKEFHRKNGSSFIFTKEYIKEQVDAGLTKGWMSHQHHDMSRFNIEKTPLVIQRCWHGENIYFRKRKLKDYAKWFFSISIDVEKF